MNNPDPKTSPDKLKITLCMGSSCYSRGNGKLIDVLKTYLKDFNIEPEIAGHLCENKCAFGPNIIIDGEHHSDVRASDIPHLLRKYIKKCEVPK